jgi:hypothetical protein
VGETLVSSAARSSARLTGTGEESRSLNFHQERPEMLRPADYADPSIYQSTEANVEFAIKWSKDESMVTLDTWVDGQKKRLKMSAEQADLLREFLNANIC